MGFTPLAFVDWEGQASWANPLLQHVGVEMFNVGGWLTHGDLAMEVGVDFLAVVERRLAPARVRSEWARLEKKGWLLFVLQLARNLPMLVMLKWVLLASGVHMLLSLPLPLPSLGVSLIVVGWSGVLCRWVLVGSCIW